MKENVKELAMQLEIVRDIYLHDPEAAHSEADDLLIAYIDNETVTEVYESMFN